MDAILTTGGGNTTIPILTEDPENPAEGEMWVIYNPTQEGG